MNIKTSRDVLAEALQAVGRAVSARSTVQILSGILLRAEEQILEAAATDMEVSIRARVTAEVTETGAAVVPGRLLLDITRVLPAGEVALAYDANEGLLNLRSGSSSYRLNTYAAADYPRLPEPAPGELFAVPQEPFFATLARVSRAASRDESRPVLTGILVRLSGDRLTMAATDSYRLSVKETPLAAACDRDVDAIIPARALGELVRAGQASREEHLQVAVQDNQVMFGSNAAWLSARRIDGQFPNYEQLKPDGFEGEARIGRDELADAVRRVAVLAPRNTAMRLRFADSKLTIRAQTQDVGEAEESLPVAFSGESIEIGFNPQFLLEGVESVDSEEVRIRLINPLRPGLLAGERDDFWYLIMPIRLAS
ncbi:MAG: DNA polymerase III subunit beta [Actinomycetia bacterium]|nr:DNA polymerase III subunit beta [Actinomycetes bacterium]